MSPAVEADYSFDFNPRPPGVPAELWAAFLDAIRETADRAGYEVAFRQDTGLGVAYLIARRDPEAVP